MLEDQGFCGHDAPAARTQKPRQGDEQMDPQNHKIAHASNRTTLEIQQWGIAQRCAPELNFTNSHPTGSCRARASLRSRLRCVEIARGCRGSSPDSTRTEFAPKWPLMEFSVGPYTRIVQKENRHSSGCGPMVVAEHSAEALSALNRVMG